MPIYEYDCNNCGVFFERLVRSSAHADKIACPKCNSRKITRRMSVCAHTVAGGSASAESDTSRSSSGHTCSGNCSGGCSCGRQH